VTEPHDIDSARLERLRSAVERLPREVAPPPETWDAIRDRIEAQRIREIGPGNVAMAAPRSAPRSAPRLLRGLPRIATVTAAAVVIVAVGIGIRANRTGGGPDAVDQHAAPPISGGATAPGHDSAALVPPQTASAVIPASIRSANPGLAAALRSYHDASRDLEVAVAARTATMSPATREVVRRSLATIDTAIAELRAALGDDPRNARLGTQISGIYEQKLDFLRRVRALPAAGM
jgi:hypothetical protein